jgi:hypothetical protein
MQEIEVLKVAMETYKQCSPVSSTSPYNQAEIVEALEGFVLKTVRLEAQNLANIYRQQVEEKISEKDTETYTAVWEKLTTTLSVVDTIMNRISHEPEQTRK